MKRIILQQPSPLLTRWCGCYPGPIEEFLERYPGITRAMIQILVAWVRSTTHHVEAMTFQDVQGRLAYEMLNLAVRHGRGTDDVIEIDIPLTQGDLATIVGATRESVNKAFSALYLP